MLQCLMYVWYCHYGGHFGEAQFCGPSEWRAEGINHTVQEVTHWLPNITAGHAFRGQGFIRTPHCLIPVCFSLVQEEAHTYTCSHTLNTQWIGRFRGLKRSGKYFWIYVILLSCFSEWQNIAWSLVVLLLSYLASMLALSVSEFCLNRGSYHLTVRFTAVSRVLGIPLQ